MKIIPLSQGKVAQVDDNMFDYLSQWKWYASKDGDTFYALRHEQSNYKRKTFLMHRMILSASHRKWVDHKDRDGLNNQRGNLRFCNSALNQRNSKIRTDNTSGYRGVCWNKEQKRFSAYFYIKRSESDKRQRRVHLGYFTTAIEAARAFDKAVSERFGEFANTNFPRSAA